VNADDRGLRVNIAHHKRDGALHGLAAGFTWLRKPFEAENAEVSPARGKIGVGNLGNTNERHNKIIDSDWRQKIQLGAAQRNKSTILEQLAWGCWISLLRTRPAWPEHTISRLSLRSLNGRTPTRE
jgi:hypothetical protein